MLNSEIHILHLPFKNMKVKHLAFSILALLFVGCNSSKESGETKPELVIDNVNIYTQKPLIHVNDTVFFSVTYNSNLKNTSSGIDVSLNGQSPVGAKLEYNEISPTEYKGYFLPIKTKGEYNLIVKFDKNGKSFNFGKKIKVVDNYSLSTAWDGLKSYDEVKAIAPFATFKDNYPLAYTKATGPDFIDVGIFFKKGANKFADVTTFIEGFYGKYSLIYDTNKTLVKIRLHIDPVLINYNYEDVVNDVKEVYGNSVRNGTNQYTGFKFSEFEKTPFKIKIEQISYNTIYTEITKNIIP